MKKSRCKWLGPQHVKSWAHPPGRRRVCVIEIQPSRCSTCHGPRSQRGLLLSLKDCWGAKCRWWRGFSCGPAADQFRER